MSTFFRITSVLFVYNFRIRNKTNILAMMHDESSFQGITFFFLMTFYIKFDQRLRTEDLTV